MSRPHLSIILLVGTAGLPTIASAGDDSFARAKEAYLSARQVASDALVGEIEQARQKVAASKQKDEQKLRRLVHCHRSDDGW